MFLSLKIYEKGNKPSTSAVLKKTETNGTYLKSRGRRSTRKARNIIETFETAANRQSTRSISVLGSRTSDKMEDLLVEDSKKNAGRRGRGQYL